MPSIDNVRVSSGSGTVSFATAATTQPTTSVVTAPTGLVGPSGLTGATGPTGPIGPAGADVEETLSLATIATNTTGVATATLQTTGNTSLVTIATNTTGIATAANQTAANTSLSAIAANTTLGATTALQTAGNVSLATIATSTAVQATATGQATGNAALSTIATNTTGVATTTLQSAGNTSLATIATGTATQSTAALQTTGNTSLAAIATSTAASATAAGQASQLTPITATASALGTPADVVWSGTGTSTVVAALKALWGALTGMLTVKQPDARATGQTIAAATLNAAVTVTLNGGQGVVGWQVSGLTASAAVLMSEYSNDGVTWSSHNLAGSPFTNLISADGQYRANGGGHAAVRLRVSTIGTGTVLVAYTASSVSSLVDLGASLPTGTNALGSITQTPTALTNSTAGTMGTAAAIIVPFSATRKWLMITSRTAGTEIQDIGSSNVTVGGGIPLAPSGGFLFNGGGASGPVYGITTVAGSHFSYVEG